MAYHPFRHLGLKFLSIALAVAIWLIVGDQRSVERSVRVPLEFHNVPDGLELVANPPDGVEVRLRGPSSALGRVLPGEVVAVLDLQAARVGTRLFHLLADEVRVPYGVQVSQVNPSAISLSFEPSVTKSVPVVPAVDGDPAPGFHVGRISATPPLVAVVGPASHVVELKSATTEPVVVARARSSVVDRVTVGVADELVRLVTPQTATVTVEIVATAIEKRLTGVAVIPRNTPTGRTARITPATVDLVVRGPATVVDALTSIGVFVDLAGLAAGRFELPLHIDSVPSVDVQRTEPSTVDVRIR
jgi:YbbR domain-containing protein